MCKIRQIAIILPDALQRTGLQSLLAAYFPPVEIAHFSSFECMVSANNDLYDYYFTLPETFVLNADFFLPRKAKTVLLINRDTTPSTGNNLPVLAPQEAIIENLQQLFASDGTNPTNEKSKELSIRETDVLKRIVQGLTNKDIADALNISLNTVLSHRKNITSKLGIKTVSGLTFYAIMNGLVSSDLIG
ncbi:MAG: LuxR C-terminal-related transcriptional regulator [Tannerellaceae bacterium]|jgi:DNA-binding CsgD family transcriptional regulator|nr:LuxR C-terminal-related transcriptional regulator [Tannerellaceae bacterium]